MSKIENIAGFIINQHKEKKPYSNLPDNLKPENIEEAYLAQNFFHDNIGRGVLGGYKIALASKVQQELCGIDHPIAGGIFKDEIYNSPSEINIDNFYGLGLEFELAMEISHEITNDMGSFDKENIKQYISNIYAAFEMIIDRDANYNVIDPYSMVADNAWCGGIVLGNPIEDWKKVNFEEKKSILYWNDEKHQNANIIDSNPFESLAWVINLKLSQNSVIPKGSKIITGSVIKTRAPKKGDSITYEVPNLSSVKIKII
tara:strand:+ start:337 stop:1110 length:774 start_codon:yes stop_codon:yes gene_type:complete